MCPGRVANSKTVFPHHRARRSSTGWRQKTTVCVGARGGEPLRASPPGPASCDSMPRCSPHCAPEAASRIHTWLSLSLSLSLDSLSSPSGNAASDAGKYSTQEGAPPRPPLERRLPARARARSITTAARSSCLQHDLAAPPPRRGRRRLVVHQSRTAMPRAMAHGTQRRLA